jgi:putative endonuclease
MTQDRQWFVYLLECVDGSIYTGIALDVAARFAAHRAGRGARYTRSHPPLRVLASIACADRATALREEHRIKQLSPAAKRAYADGLQAAEPSRMDDAK